MPQPVLVFATGDLIIDEPAPDHSFDPARATLAAAEVLVGHFDTSFAWCETRYS